MMNRSLPTVALHCSLHLHVTSSQCSPAAPAKLATLPQTAVYPPGSLLLPDMMKCLLAAHPAPSIKCEPSLGRGPWIHGVPPSSLWATSLPPRTPCTETDSNKITNEMSRQPTLA